jgi:hypothetical protein
LLREYLFIFDSTQWSNVLMPAVRQLEDEGSSARLRRLMWDTNHDFEGIAKRTSLGTIGRAGFVALIFELGFWSLVNKDKAVQQTRGVAAPELFEAVCLVEILPGRTTLDVASFRLIEWLCTNSRPFVRAFRSGERLPLNIQFGEACVIYPPNLIAILRRELGVAVPEEFTEEKNLLLGILDQVSSHANLVLGLTVM